MKASLKYYSAGLLFLSVFFCSVATAIPVVTNADRQVYIGDAASGTHMGPNSPYAGTGLFVDEITMPLGSNGKTVKASENSDIQAGSGLFAGSGDVSVDFSVLMSDGVYAVSQYFVEFDLSTDHTYSLSGLLYANMDGGDGLATFSLIGPSGLLFTAYNWESVSLADSGILTAGSYQLLVSAEIDNGGNSRPGSYMGGSSSYEFEFLLDEIDYQIPEPETLALLAIALFGFAYCRRINGTV